MNRINALAVVAVAVMTACEGPFSEPSAVNLGTATQASLTAPLLSYHSGPVISRVRVSVLFWSSQVRFQGSLPGFFSSVTNSAYMDWLSEYNTPTQSISRGSFVSAVVDPNPPAGTSLTETQIIAELVRLIGNGTLPPAGPNSLYMVYLPPGYVATVQAYVSCTAGGGLNRFCGIHQPFSVNGTMAAYGIIPDLGSCGTFCGPSDAFGNTTATSSHELLEAVTDPAFTAWWDSSSSYEISDICQRQLGTVAGYTVQLAWSNRQQACVQRSDPCQSCAAGTSCHCGDSVCRVNGSLCP